MKKFNLNFVAVVCGALTLGSCSEEVFNEETMVADSRLTVSTRAEGDALIATPVRVYVFNSSDKCVAMPTLDEGNSSFTIDLPEGTYGVYAVGGADQERLTLPAQDEAAKTAVIQLKENQKLGDLMTAQGNVTLATGGTNSLTLGMQRKVMMIQSITIKDVPQDVSSVSVRIAPLYESIRLNGEYTGESGSYTCSLAKQDDAGTWIYDAADSYLFPAVGNPTISITLGDKTYSYACTETLPANQKLTIEGTYVDNSGTPDITLTGTIEGTKWDDGKSITFQFTSDSAQSSTGGSTPAATIPEVGSKYKDCYVVAVNGNNIIVWSSKTAGNLISKTDDPNTDDIIATELSNWYINGITTKWVLPEEDVAKAIFSIRDKFPDKYVTASSYFFIDGKGKTNSFNLTNQTFSAYDGVFKSSELRPVTTITIE